MAATANPIELTDRNFDEEVCASDRPVLVDFWAGWCGPCHQIAPIVEELAEEYEGRAKVGKLNVDENPQTAREYGVRSIPTLLFFKDGEMEEQVVGAAGKQSLKQRLEELIGQPA
ncbi:MAG: thioredoxin [Salinivenus sp.]